MDVSAIKAAPSLNLKPNAYFQNTKVPFLYQKKGSLVMLAAKRMVLGDDVGLGKTLEAIVAFSYLKTANPRLKAVVLTEKIALKQWEEQFVWLTPTIKTRIITAITHPDPTNRVAAIRQFTGDVIISTYSIMYKYRKYVLDVMKDGFVLIADEPSYFKNTTSRLHRAMWEVSQQAQRAYGLTATIVENRLEEAFAIFRVICPGHIESKIFFEKEFCIKRKLPRKKQWVVCGYKNLDKFRRLIEPVFYGRLQEDPEVKQALPEAIPKDLPIELLPEQSRKVVEAMDRIIQMPSGAIVNIQILPSLIMAQQMVDDPRLKGFGIGGAKTDALIDALQNSLVGQRVLVYCNLRSMVHMLQKDLQKAGISVARITGTENDNQREDAKQRFMSDDPARKVDVLIGNRAIAKAMDGIQKKSGHIFFYDLPWSYGIYRQLVGRLKRTGSVFKVVGVYRMLGVLHSSVAGLLGTVDTIDHHVLRTVMRKKGLFDAITGDTVSIETSPSDLVDIWNEIRSGYKKV